MDTLAKFIVCLNLLVNPGLLFSNSANDTSLWKSPTSPLKLVFTNKNNKEIKEILKLYKDLSFEFLSYSNKTSVLLKRISGNYEFKGSCLKLYSQSDKKYKASLFTGKLYFVKGKGIYNSMVKSIFLKNQCFMEERKKSEYDFPFYLDPNKKIIVKNSDAVDKLDLKDLVTCITKNKASTREKMNAIINFINTSIEYDYEGLKSDVYANPQNNSKKILAGKKRLAVCAGYAHVFEELCTLAGINCKQIIGYAKNSKYYIEKYGGRHAWNKVNIDGKEELYDITWADGAGDYWLNVNPEIMIYTHFPDNTADQLLDKPLSLEDFKNSPVIFHNSANSRLGNFYPKAGKVFCDSVFVFCIDGYLPNLSVNELDGEYFKTSWSADLKKSPDSYNVNYITNFRKYTKENKTYIEIPIKKSISCITLNADGFSYTYKVMKGDIKQFYSNYIKNSNKNNLDDFIKGVAASIALNDAKKLGELTGEKNDVFFEKNGKIKNDLLNAFKNWDGSIAEIEKNITSHLEITSNNNKRIKKETTVIETAVKVANCKLVFEKKDKDYLISKIK